VGAAFGSARRSRVYARSPNRAVEVDPGYFRPTDAQWSLRALEERNRVGGPDRFDQLLATSRGLAQSNKHEE
jgi:hypothetical protein